MQCDKPQVHDSNTEKNEVTSNTKQKHSSNSQETRVAEEKKQRRQEEEEEEGPAKSETTRKNPVPCPPVSSPSILLGHIGLGAAFDRPELRGLSRFRQNTSVPTQAPEWTFIVFTAIPLVRMCRVRDSWLQAKAYPVAGPNQRRLIDPRRLPFWQMPRTFSY